MAARVDSLLEILARTQRVLPDKQIRETIRRYVEEAALLPWIGGDKVHEAEVVITNASVLAHGRAISFEVKLGAVNSLPANRVH